MIAVTTRLGAVRSSTAAPHPNDLVYKLIALLSNSSSASAVQNGWRPPRSVEMRPLTEHVARRRRETLSRLRADPDLAALEVFLLPDRHDLLQAINRETTGLESHATVSRGDGDHDTGFADWHDTDAVHDGGEGDRPALL